MTRDERFHLRLSAADRQALRALAELLRRSQSDTIRWLIHEAAHDLAFLAEGEPADA